MWKLSRTRYEYKLNMRIRYFETGKYISVYLLFPPKGNQENDALVLVKTIHPLGTDIFAAEVNLTVQYVSVFEMFAYELFIQCVAFMRVQIVDASNMMDRMN
ncbi:hypothetical protein TNIN_16231 [Trichonephila inaurata madagascariensis]|uniref:Uncharacterized protein n=1 Tax=Trichonephila inaurata madagascariensis TaxID=2747483 RepID=A0A8X7CGE4_9ARAC|nr:hypothetical protein TNIN_16231 [Trichonephila inaurata madagascariensis]